MKKKTTPSQGNSLDNNGRSPITGVPDDLLAADPATHAGKANADTQAISPASRSEILITYVRFDPIDAPSCTAGALQDLWDRYSAPFREQNNDLDDGCSRILIREADDREQEQCHVFYDNSPDNMLDFVRFPRFIAESMARLDCLQAVLLFADFVAQNGFRARTDSDWHVTVLVEHPELALLKGRAKNGSTIWTRYSFGEIAPQSGRNSARRQVPCAGTVCEYLGEACCRNLHENQGTGVLPPPDDLL